MSELIIGRLIRDECGGKCEEEEDCQFITFTNFRNIGVCHLLRDCQEKVKKGHQLIRQIFSFKYRAKEPLTVFFQYPPCSSESDCVSVPKSCNVESDVKKCARLESKAESGSHARSVSVSSVSKSQPEPQMEV